MRLVTCRIDGESRAAALVGEPGDERVVDLHAADPDLPADVLGLIRGGPALLDRATGAVAGASGAPLSEVTLLAPIPRPPKIICIGVNYADHAAEEAQAGKSHAWNELVHRIASPRTDAFVMMDEDIEFGHADTVHKCLGRLFQDDHVQVVVDLPLKDFTRKSRLTAFERISAGV